MTRVVGLLLAGGLRVSACAYGRLDNPSRFRGCLPACPTAVDLSGQLAEHVDYLAREIGPRSYLAPEGLTRAADYIKKQLERGTGPKPAVTSYTMADLGPQTTTKMRKRARARQCLADWEAAQSVTSQQVFENIELTIPGKGGADEAIVVGAHYDSDACESGGCNPGADDNATGVAALIELAKRVAAVPQPQRTVRFVAFTNEEEPFFWTEGMGGRQYLIDRQRRHVNEKIAAMLSIETIGYYRDEREPPAAATTTQE